MKTAEKDGETDEGGGEDTGSGVGKRKEEWRFSIGLGEHGGAGCSGNLLVTASILRERMKFRQKRIPRG